MKLRDGRKYSSHLTTASVPQTEYLKRRKTVINKETKKNACKEEEQLSRTLPLPDLAPVVALKDCSFSNAACETALNKKYSFEKGTTVEAYSANEKKNMITVKNISSSTLVTCKVIQSAKEHEVIVGSTYKLTTSTPIPLSRIAATTNGISKRKDYEAEFNSSSTKVDAPLSNSIRSISMKDYSYNEKLGISRERHVNRSLEDSVFHDISFTNLGKIWKDNSFLKIDGSCFMDDLSCDEEERDRELNMHFSVNHIQRSQYRQNRREWYLKRRIYAEKTFFYRYILQYIFFFTSMTVYATRKVLHFIRLKTANTKLTYRVKYYTNAVSRFKHFLISNIFMYRLIHKYVKNKMTSWQSWISSQLGAVHDSNMVNMYINKKGSVKYSDLPDGNAFVENGKEDENDDFVAFCCWNCGLGLLCVLFFAPLLIFGTTIFAGNQLLVLPTPAEFKISNAYALFLSEKEKKIPAWHIRPPSATMYPIEKSFSTKLPVVLYLRESGLPNSKHRVQVYEVLTSLGYHVIVPIEILSRGETIMAWTWLKRKTGNVYVYIWGDQMETRVLTGYAKDFCNELIPPSGVIIEYEHTFQQQRNLEIWSCNCTLVPNFKKGDTFFKYNHVKCPVTIVDDEQLNIYNQVVTCVQAVMKRSEM